MSGRNCGKGNGNGNHNASEERNAVLNRLEGGLERLEASLRQTGVTADADAQVAVINKRLFKGITKDELVASIVTADDVLSLDGLIAREDVQTAMVETGKIRDAQVTSIVDSAVATSQILHEMRTSANEIYEAIVIFGITDEIRDDIVAFDQEIADIIEA